MKISQFKKHLAAGLILFSCGGLHAQVIYRTGGPGGFGGGGFRSFGGGGFGGANGGQSSGAVEYNNNGAVGSASIAVDPDTHNIVVIADRETAAQIQRVIQDLDRPKPQVLIKVVFLEVQHNNSSDIGVEGGWTKGIGNNMTANAANVFGLSGLNAVTTNFNILGQGTAALSPTVAPGAGFYQILGGDFQATLRAIAQAGHAQLLSRPSILARDGQPATIVVGQSVPLVTSVSYTGLAATTPVNNITYTDVGIILKVTPFISSRDDMVEMILSPQISSVDPTLTQTISPGVTAPYIDVRSADTVVDTPNAQTVVIGGLMENNKSSNDNKIPFLGDIPILGNLFKARQKSDAKSELVIFLTPHIVPAPRDLVSMSAQESRQAEMITNSVSEEELDRFLERAPMKRNP
ncbi:MAG: hypothetical protein KGR98_06035 [Verrucomicrobia bacterium]|nr:hypothetical protein [Verrucomicrobiota bacterium]MDE3099536.1 hypothetical protein [Verrucomicrobiota bacterium]